MGSEFSCTRPERGSAQAAPRIALNATVVRHGQRAAATARSSSLVPVTIHNVRASGPQLVSSSGPSASEDLAIIPAPKDPVDGPSSKQPDTNNSSSSNTQYPVSSSSTPTPVQAGIDAASSSPSWTRWSRGSGPVLDLGHWEPPELLIYPNRSKRQSVSSAEGGPSQSPRTNVGRRTSLPATAHLKWPFTPTHQEPEAAVYKGQPLPSPLSEFTCFPNLPMEIRLLVFQFCAFLPRTVPVFYHLHRTNPVYSSHPPPPILQVCREGRLEARKFYKNAFGTKALVNLSVDTIFLENLSAIVYVRNDNLFTAAYHPVRQTPSGDPTSCILPLLRAASKDELQAIRFLAVGCNSKAFPKNYPQTWHTIGTYRQLKEKVLPNLEVLTYALEMNKLSLGMSVRNVSSFEQVQDRKKEIGRGLEMRFLPLECDEKWKERAKIYIDGATKYYEWHGLNVVVKNLWVGLRENAESIEKSPGLAIQNDACGRLDVDTTAQNPLPLNPRHSTLRAATVIY